jgi:hypothetical protein
MIEALNKPSLLHKQANHREAANENKSRRGNIKRPQHRAI